MIIREKTPLNTFGDFGIVSLILGKYET